MNHTERIAETARRHRHLSRRLVKEAIETYLELLADEITEGEWVDIYGIGRIQVVVEKGANMLTPIGKTVPQKIQQRLRSRLRLFSSFKYLCYRNHENRT